VQLFHQLDTGLEFVKCSGKSCRIPQTAAEFEMNGEACSKKIVWVRRFVHTFTQ